MTDIDNLQISNASKIYEASRNNDLVIFVGAGVSANSGVPDWSQLVNEFKKSLPDSVRDEHDFLKIAQLYKEAVPSGDYISNIQGFLKDGKAHPNPIHDAIFSLSPSHVITTNYDNLIEQAAENARVHFSIIRSDRDIPRAKSSRYLIKMHGDFISQKFVLTESDYYNYTVDYPLVDTLVKSLFASKTILCVGFSFNDLNLKIILNRIQSMLGNNAKPIYLLANYNENPVFYNYLKNKGIQPFWLPTTIIDEFASEVPTSFNSDIGVDTFKQLSCLQYDVSKPLDIIDALYSYSQMIEGEMPFFYMSRLKKILPDKICKWDHTYSMGIQLESEYIKALIEQCKTIEGKRRLLREKGGKIHSLIKTAANNCIFEFDRIELWKLKSFQRYWNKKEKDSCSLLIDFDFRALAARIETLELADINYSYRDLELPFIKWMLGDIISSYELYESLEGRYWNSNNSILYFLCVFNKQALFNGSFPLDGMAYEKICDLSEKVSKINVSNILAELFLDSRVKENLSDLINNQYYVDTFSSVCRLTNEILEDKYRSEHHGFSSNSHIAELSSKLTRSFDYSHVNYVITTNTGSAYESYRTGIIGLLNAHKIKATGCANGLFGGSRLESIKPEHLKLILFTLEANDLKRAFDIYRIDSLLLDNDAVAYIHLIVNNLLRDSEIIRSMLRNDLIVNKLACLFVLCSMISNGLNITSEIVDITIEYNLLSDRLQFDFHSVICSIICKSGYQLTEKQCQEILSTFPINNQHLGVNSLYSLVSSRMKQAGWKSNYRLEQDEQNGKPFWQLLNEMYLYYDIVPDDDRDRISKIIRVHENISKEELRIICALIVNKHAYNLLSHDIVSKISNMPDNYDGGSLRGRTLKEIVLNCSDADIKNEILELGKTDPCLSFYLNPLSYDGNIDLHWLNYINDECFKALIKREDIIQAIKQPDVDMNIRDRFWKMV